MVDYGFLHAGCSTLVLLRWYEARDGWMSQVGEGVNEILCLTDGIVRV